MSARHAITRSPRRCRLGVLAAILTALTLTLLVLPATPASAACEGDPPAPTHPGGLLGQDSIGHPAWSTVPDTAPDPFTDPGVRLVDVYGYGYQWGTYDLGCGPDIARSPLAVLDTQISNIGWTFPTAAAVMVAKLRHLATMGPFDFLDPLVTSIQATVKAKLWTRWLPVALLVAGGWILFRARRADYSATAQTLGWIGLIFAVSSLFLQFPATAEHWTSRGMREVVNIASSPFDTTSIDEQIDRHVLYPQWLQGELGTTTGPTASTYGPKLLWATHYTWSDEKQIAHDHTAKDRIDQAKAAAFKQAAEAIKNSDPTAYQYLTGHQGETRITSVAFAALYTVGLGLFVIIGFVILALAQLIVRAFLIGFPIAGLIAVAHPRGQFAVMQLWSLFTAAFLAAVKFAVVTGLYTLFAAGVMNAPVGGLGKLGALLLLTILGLLFAHPLRSFKTMVPGLDPGHSYTMGLGRRLLSYAVTKEAVAAGVEDAAESSTSTDGTTAPSAAAGKARMEDDTLGPLPAIGPGPAPASAAAAGPVHTTMTAEPARPADSATVGEVTGIFAPTALPASPHVVGSHAEAPASLTAGPTRTSRTDGASGGPRVVSALPPGQSPSPDADAASGEGHTTGRPAAVDVHGQSVHVVGQDGEIVSPPAAGRQPEGQGADGGVDGTWRLTAATAAAAPTAGGEGPAASSSEPAQAAPPSESTEPMYSRLNSATTQGETIVETGDLPMADKQIDRDGSEIYVIYHRGDNRASTS